MSTEILPFDFEEQAVRVVMREDEPWFVAADVCRVLEIGNSRDAVSRLDDDEREVVNLNTVGKTDTIRGNPNATIISESGLYALVLTSRKEQARRFRKWVTAEVLPAIRKQGRYEHRLPAGAATGGEIAGLPLREAEIWLQLVREARLTRGRRAAVSIWTRSPLPQIGPDNAPASAAEGRECLAHVLDVAGAAIAARDVRALNGWGLRLVEDGLFVANPAHPAVASLFAGTRWAGGGWRAALLALGGAMISNQVLSIGGEATRGVVVPGALVEAREVADA